jgi:hypothetical protein
MQSDAVFRKFTERRRIEVILRTPKWSGLDDVFSFIGDLVEGEVMIAIDVKKTRDSVTGSRN